MNARLFRNDNKVWRLGLVAGVALLAAGLVACSGSDDSGDDAVPASEPGMAFSTGGTSAGGMGMDGDFAGEKAESGAGNLAPAPAQTGAQESGDPGLRPIADVLGRQVIRNGSVELTVESVDEAFEEVRGVVDQAGGYLASSTFSGREESQRARMTVRVPAEKFDQVIADLRNLAVEVESVSTSSQDVTEEFTDLEASLRNLKAVEAQYLTLLGEAGDIGEILQVQDRLNGVRYELERVQGRLNLLENQTSLATLEVALYPESSAFATEPTSGFGAEVREAWESSLDFIATAGTGIVVALVWSWWLIPFVLIAALLARRFAGRLASMGRTRPATDRVDTPEGAA